MKEGENLPARSKHTVISGEQGLKPRFSWFLVQGVSCGSPCFSRTLPSCIRCSDTDWVTALSGTEDAKQMEGDQIPALKGRLSVSGSGGDRG